MKTMRVAVSILAFTFSTEAFALCKEGTVAKCTINGKPGEKECTGLGWSACLPTTEPPPPVTGTVDPKYLILNVIYAPPGTKASAPGQTASSLVNYGADSTAGTTTSGAKSYKADYSVTASVSGGFLCTGDKCTIGASGGGSYEYSTNHTHTDAMDIKKTTSSSVQVNGPGVDGVDHGSDTIWLLLRPKLDVTVAGKDITWTFDNSSNDPSAANIPIFVYVDHLKNPAKMQSDAPTTFRELQAAGLTTQDFPDILKADPLAGCAPPVLELARIARPPTGISPPCNPVIPAAPRYVNAHQTFPYEPPHDANSTVPLQTFAVDNATVSTQTDSDETVNKVGVTAEGSFNFLTVWKASLKTDDSWTWTSTNSTATSTGDTQKMSLTIGGPAFGYSGAGFIAVYYDTLYKTFAFMPFDISANTLHGVILDRTKKPVAAKLVTATVRGVTYRTYTNSEGEYRFPAEVKGAVDLFSGGVRQRLPAVDASKSVDFGLPR